MSGRVRKFGIYFLMEGFQKASAIFLIPIYTAYMNPEQFGILSTCMSISAMAPVLLYFNIYEAAYFVLIRKEDEARRKVSTVIVLEIIIALTVISLVIGCGLFVPRDRVLFGIDWYPYGFYTLIMSALAVFPLTVNQILLASEKVRAYSIFTFSSFVVSVSLILILLIKFRLGAMSFIIGNSLTYGVVLLMLVVWIRRSKEPFRGDEVKKMVRFSAPLVPHNMAHWARSWSDRLLLATFVSPASTGLFHLAVSYGNIFLFGVEAFRNSNNPRFFALIGNVEKERERITSMLSLSVGVFSFFACILGVFSEEVISLLTTRDFHGSYRYIPFVLTANLFYLAYLNMVVVLFNGGKTWVISTITTISAVVSVAAGAALIANISITGAGISMVASNFLMATLVYVEARKMSRLQWPFLKAVLFALLPLVLLFLSFHSLSMKVLFLLFIAALIGLMVRRDAASVGITWWRK